MIEVLPEIYKIDPSNITPSKYISFFARRESGNLLFPCLASSSTFESSWSKLHDLGGVTMQLLGDMHFATKHNDVLYEEFGAKTYCSELEEQDVRRKVKHVEALAFERMQIAPGILSIPTPGHRPGAVSYLLQQGTSGVLLAGDSIWHNGTKWLALASKKTRRTMKHSLDRLSEESFTTLLANSSVTNTTFRVDFDSPNEKNRFLKRLSDEL